MSYTYGMQGSPAVGGGLGGLPSRSYIGEIREFSSYPGGDWLQCNGQIFRSSDYPVLARQLISSSPNLVSVSVVGSTIPLLTDTGFNYSGMMSRAQNASGDRIVIVGPSGFTGYAVFTDDYGVSWSTVYCGLSFSSSPGISDIECSTGGTWMVVGNEGKVGISTDNGSSWSVNTAAQTLLGGTQAISVHTNDRGTWLIRNTSGVTIRSANNGSTWATVSTGLPASEGYAACNTGSTWVLCATTSTIAVSQNDGQTWGTITLPAAVTAVSCVNNVFIAYNSSNQTAYISTDNGVTWAAHTTAKTLGTSMQWKRKAGCYTKIASIASNDIPILVSRDGGLSITNAVLQWRSSTCLPVDMGKNGKFYFAQSNNTAFRLWEAASGLSSTAFNVPLLQNKNAYIKAM